MIVGFCTLAGVGCARFATEYTGRVVDVKDGNRLTFEHDGQREDLRLYGIDCPELEQPFGEQAKAETQRLTAQKTVTVKAWGLDAYDGRLIAVVVLPDGRQLHEVLLREGLAWRDPAYTNEPELAAMQEEARVTRRGLWAEENPVPPWEFRPDWKR